jgi:hypothetical protein
VEHEVGGEHVARFVARPRPPADPQGGAGSLEGPRLGDPSLVVQPLELTAKLIHTVRDPLRRCPEPFRDSAFGAGHAHLVPPPVPLLGSRLIWQHGPGASPERSLAGSPKPDSRGCSGGAFPEASEGRR